jgi:hypothetical protein
VRTAGVSVMSFILGVLLALLLRPSVKEPPPPECPVPAPCPTCQGPPPPPAPVKRPAVAPRKSPPTPVAVAAPPEVALDEEAQRARLRSWFESNADRLADCVPKGAPMKRVLIEIKIEPEGAISDASLLGADLDPEAIGCVRDHIKSLKAPREMLRGRERLVVHLNL